MENDKDQGAAVRGEAVAEVLRADYNAGVRDAMRAITEAALQPGICGDTVVECGRLAGALLRARAADAPSEPSEKKAAAWIDQFGNVFPLGAYQPSGKPSYLDADKRGWKPLFRAADALDSQTTDDRCTECGLSCKSGNCCYNQNPAASKVPPSIRESCDFLDFQEDLQRLSEPGLSRKQAKLIRQEIIRVIDARVRAFAAPQQEGSEAGNDISN